MALQTVVCAACASSFTASRSDAETCSGRCRARISRQRRATAEAARAERLAAHVDRAAAEVERAAALLASLRAASALTASD